MAHITMGGALPKKGAVPGSARIPGLATGRKAAQVRAMMEHISPQTQGVVALMPMLARRARRLTRSPSEAEDLVQDTLLSLCQRLKDGGAIDDLPAYAMQTLSNRARRNWGRDVPEELDDTQAIVHPDAMIRLDCADTLHAVAHLPPPQRQLMDLVVAGESSPRALAQVTGLPLGTVMSRLARARARLRRTLHST